jgi:hypothetical protein
MTTITVGDPTTCAVLYLCNPIPSVGGSVGSSLAHDAATAVLTAVTSDLTSAASWLISHVVQLVSGSSQVRLDQPWFLDRTKVMLQLAEFVVLPLLFAASIGPVLRQDLRRLFRVWAVGLPVAIVIGLSVVELTQLAISALDALSNAIVGSSKVALDGELRGLAQALTMPGAPQLVAALISFLLIVGSVLLWMELVVRAAAIYVAVFFAPLALACYVWPATMSVAKRTIELLAALILSKFVIVATLTLGVAALRGAPSPDNVVIGAAILLLAGFAPFSLLRLVPVVEAGAIGHLEGLSRRPLRFTGRAATTVVTAPTNPMAGLLVARSGPSHPPRAAPVAAQHVAERPADYPASSSSGTGSA